MALEIPKELLRGLPDGALKIDWKNGWQAGIDSLLAGVKEQMGGIFAESFGAIGEILLVLVLAALAEALFLSAAGREQFRYVTFAAAAAVLLLTVGEVDQLMGLGEQTVMELESFSKVLLPTLAAAMASMGLAGAGALRQVSTVMVCDLLLTFLSHLILPLIWLHLSALAAGSMLSDKRLLTLAGAIKKGIIWFLGLLLTLFSLYLAIAGAVAGSMDSAALRTAKRAVSAAVPVVGGILSAAADTIFAGAGLLKNTVGLFGVLAVFAVCLVPFLRLGIQYLCFKLTAFLASAVAPPPLAGLIDGLAGVFALVLAAAGSCAVVLLVSLISALLVVTP